MSESTHPSPAVTTIEPIVSIDALFGVLASGYGTPESTGGGERVDQLAHALQCAYEVSLARPHDDELQIAALVHDIGHLLVPGDDSGHGRHAAAAVADLLGARIAALVELHVDAKRYLVTTDPAYQGVLSTTSVRTLLAQGGGMTGAEVAAFERARWSLDAVVLRQADDAAKVPGRSVPPLMAWRPVVELVVGDAAR